jgi:outer membrane murein-binding lipoprotein Lpp
MKSNNRKPACSEIIIGIIAALVVGVIVFAIASANRPVDNNSRLVATLDATTAALLTSVPQATPVTGAFAERIRALETAIQNCPDYPERRQPIMQQYIDWLFAPNTIPSDMIILFSPNPTNKLVFAMAADTSTEWRRLDRPADSCLVPIGRELNLLLTEMGEEPISVYDE